MRKTIIVSIFLISSFLHAMNEDYEQRELIRKEAREAVLNGDIETIKQFLDEEKIAINEVIYPACSYTTLHGAACVGNDELIEFLLDQGAGINYYQGPCYTPLWCAAYKGHLKTVQLLLENGADKTVGQSPEEVARDMYKGNFIWKLAKRRYKKIADTIRDFPVPDQEKEKK